MYLTDSVGDYPMVGFLPGQCKNNGKLTRFGYLHLSAGSDSMLFAEGEKVPAHELHYWDCSDSGNDCIAVKPSGKTWHCAHSTSRLYAGFPHFHFYAMPELAVRFYKACINYQEEING